jgi:hypothetical protein
MTKHLVAVIAGFIVVLLLIATGSTGGAFFGALLSAFCVLAVGLNCANDFWEAERATKAEVTYLAAAACLMSMSAASWPLIFVFPPVSPDPYKTTTFVALILVSALWAGFGLWCRSQVEHVFADPTE